MVRLLQNPSGVFCKSLNSLDTASLTPRTLLALSVICCIILPMNHAELAAALFSQGLSCSQAVFSVYAGEYGLDKDAASKIASGFGGGMGRMGQTCGAVTGAYMVIGLKYGAATGDREAKEKTYRAIREFAEQFKAKHGALDCKDLLGCDISTPEGFEEMKKRGLHEKVCTKLVRDACEIVDEMLKV